MPLTAATDAVTTYEYDGLGNLSLVVDAENGRTTYAWDERQLLWKATLGAGTAVEGTVEFAYDENGSLVTVKNPRGYETQSTYDLFDRRTQVTNALSHYATFQYDASSNLTVVEAYDSQATLLARTTRYFDEVDRLWKTVRDRFGPGLTASYPQTVVTRDAAHRVTQVTDPLSNSTSYQYDNAGRLPQVLDAAGNHRDFTLDANGNVTTLSVTDIPAAGPSETFVTEFDYDVLNRRTERREIDRLNGQNILTTTFEYDSRSDLTFRTDAENHPVRWTYDLASRLVTYERALQVGQSIDDFTQAIQETFAYDAMGRLTTLTDDNYNSTGYSYDARGRLTQTTYADTRYVTYGHDLDGNLHEWTDQNGTHVVNTHDALDRLTYRTVTRGTGVLGSTYEQFSYDGLDRMLTAVDDDYQVEMTWDSVGNLLKDRQGYNAQGQEQWMSVRTGYDDAGATTALTYPSGFQLTHGRDSIYRLTSLQDVAAATNIATFTWQGVGRLATTSNQNGTSTALHLGRLRPDPGDRSPTPHGADLPQVRVRLRQGPQCIGLFRPWPARRVVPAKEWGRRLWAKEPVERSRAESMCVGLRTAEAVAASVWRLVDGGDGVVLRGWLSGSSGKLEECRGRVGRGRQESHRHLDAGGERR